MRLHSALCVPVVHASARQAALQKEPPKSSLSRHILHGTHADNVQNAYGARRVW